MSHDPTYSPSSDPIAWDVLVVDADPATAATLAGCLRVAGHHARVVPTAAAAVATLDDQPCDLIWLALSDGGEDRGESGILDRLGRAGPAADVVVLTAADADPAHAYAQGAVDHLSGPATPAGVAAVVRRVAARRRLGHQVRSLRADRDDDPDVGFPTDSPDVRRVLELARRAAASMAPVLIVGEPGTGAGRLARAVHGWSPRAGGPLMVVAARGPADVVDADWFGSADRDGDGDEHGRVARCRGGTLVVDRVGGLPLAVQPKLLRLVADGQYERQDEARPHPADVRVVATATDDLTAAVAAGRFRADLRSALDVVRLDLPPLRARPEDVPLLAERYLAYAARRHGRGVRSFAPAALAALARHAWPGNLWELRNVVERAAWGAVGEVVEAADLPTGVRSGGAAPPLPGDPVPLRTIEDEHIRRVLASAGNARAAAAVLGIDPSTLWRRLKPRAAPDAEPPADGPTAQPTVPPARP